MLNQELIELPLDEEASIVAIALDKDGNSYVGKKEIVIKDNSMPTDILLNNKGKLSFLDLLEKELY